MANAPLRGVSRNLGPLLFDIYICDMFLKHQVMLALLDMRMTNPYTYSSDMQTVLNNFQEAIEKLFQCFSANYLVVGVDKYHLLFLKQQ